MLREGLEESEPGPEAAGVYSLPSANTARCSGSSSEVWAGVGVEEEVEAKSHLRP